MRHLLLVFLCLPAASTLALSTTAHAAAPDCRRPHIQAHLERVEAELLTADTSHLTESQQLNRARHIGVLRDYRQACRFPVNSISANRLLTIFVDEEGAHCAVGHLMAQDGLQDAVARIRKTRNTATIWELEQDTELRAWLQDAGLTLYEAARIQPSYCGPPGDCFCYGATGFADGTITKIEDLTIHVQVSAGYGSLAQTTPGTVLVVPNAFAPADKVGRRVLTAKYGEEMRRGLEMTDQGEATCANWGEAHSVPLSVYGDALAAEDKDACVERLGVHAPVLAVEPCDGGGAFGCSGGIASRDGGPMGLLVVLALLLLGSAIWVRRR